MMPQPGLWLNTINFQVLVLTSSMSWQSKKSYWQAFSYAGDSIHEAFFHLGSVPLESTVADALELCICKLSWPLGSRLWCLTVSLLLSHWYPGPGVVLDCIDSWSLSSFLLCISQSLILFDSLRWGGGCFGEKKKLNCKNYHFQELCFSKVSNVRSISESFGKTHLSLILTNQGLTIMVRGRTVINIVPLWWHCPCVDPEGDRGSGHSPWKITSTYMCFYRN